MNPKSPTALIIALIAIVLLLSAPRLSLGLIGNTLLLLAFFAAVFMTIQRRSKN
jgi:hypothetical protein